MCECGVGGGKRKRKREREIRGIESPGTRATSSCKSPDVGVGNQTRVPLEEQF